MRKGTPYRQCKKQFSVQLSPEFTVETGVTVLSLNTVKYDFSKHSEKSEGYVKCPVHGEKDRHLTINAKLEWSSTVSMSKINKQIHWVPWEFQSCLNQHC